MISGFDIHTHVVPKDLPPCRASHAALPWPSMEHASCGHANIMIAGKLFRTVSDAAWSAPRRISDALEMNIARQVISPMPELLSYWLPVEHASVLLDHVNGAIADMTAEEPARLFGMGAVPLQEVDLAVSGLRRLVNVYGLRAVEIGSNIDGVPIGDARFEPFFAAAEDLGVAVFVHALRAAGRDRLVGPALLEQIVAFPGEIALAIAGLVTGGILARHPRLRIAFSHGGGAFVHILARMEHFWESLPRFRELLAESPRITARRAFYDLAVFDPKIVRMLVECFGVEQLLIGSDYPFGAYENAPYELMRKADLVDADIATIAESNPRRYLGLG